MLQEFVEATIALARPSRFADSAEGPHFFSFKEEQSIQDTTKRVRVNRQIRISPVRVIGADGSQLGIMEVDTALRMAEEHGLDLVEVAPTARPPVVRIMDYGKYKFEQAKQARIAKKKQHVIELKEVKYRPASTITTSTRRRGMRGGSSKRRTR